jgi:hypothetical protein
MKPILVTTVLFLVTGIAIESTGSSSSSGTDKCALAGATALVADDGACTRAKQGTCRDAALGVRPCRSGTVRKSEGHDGTDEGEDCGFHLVTRLVVVWFCGPIISSDFICCLLADVPRG